MIFRIALSWSLWQERIVALGFLFNANPRPAAHPFSEKGVVSMCLSLAAGRDRISGVGTGHR